MSTSAVVKNLHVSQYRPTRIALDLVKRIIAKRGPTSTQTLYELTQKAQLTPAQLEENALEQQAMATGKPGAADKAHPVRSITFLKRSIMPVLVELNEIEKVHVLKKVPSPTPARQSPDNPPLPKVEVSQWLWQTKQLKAPKPKKIFEPSSIEAALGKDADWGHLNKRRRERREEKIADDLRLAKDLNKMRRNAAIDKSERSYRRQLENGAALKQLQLEQAESQTNGEAEARP